MSNQVFQNVRNLHPGRSMFDLSYEKKFTADMGQLIPVMCDEVLPGDYFKISNQSVIRFQPLVAPVLHEIYQYVHYFFVPYRLLWDDWEEFITGGTDGDYNDPPPEWSPVDTASGSLWDFFGFPTGVVPTGALPLDFPRRAYNLVYNEYYRDETLQDEILLTSEVIKNRNWEKDYFTSALTDQQRGVAPALPITGTTSAHWTDQVIINNAAPGSLTVATGGADPRIVINSAQGAENALNALNNNTVDLSVAATFDISDLRLAFQIQKFMERNQRSGVRYTEFLKAHYGISPRDDRMQRPEYIGGSKSPVIISEVLQTSSSDVTSPQGNLAGHGISVNAQFAGQYKALEFGLIIGIFSVMPRPAYQQGIDRQWLRKTRYDFPFPEFVNLSEQAITKAEICATGNSAHNTDIFGYQGRFDECRTKQSQICSQMRDTFDYWHCGRIFDPLNPPALNSDFITCIPRKDIFAVPSEPGLLVSFGNSITAFRPLPLQAEPGLIDHN